MTKSLKDHLVIVKDQMSNKAEDCKLKIAAGIWSKVEFP